MHPEDDNALNTEERIWDLTMQINLKGVWWGCKYAILAMRQNPTDESRGLHTGGSIINTASFVAMMGAATPQLACKYSLCSSAVNLISISVDQIPRPRLAKSIVRAPGFAKFTSSVVIGRCPGHDP